MTQNDTHTIEPSPVEEAHEPCPVPLGWQHVVQQVEQQADETTVVCDGQPVRVRVMGEGPPIYFLRGLLGTADLYSLLIWLLKDDFRCVIDIEPRGLPSLAGSGDVPAPEDPVQGWSRCLLDVASQLGDARFDLFASSFGVPTALAAMQHSPNRIGRAVLQAAFVNRQYSAIERLMLWTGRQSRQPLSSVPAVTRVLANNHGPWFPPYDGTRRQFLMDQAGLTDVATLCRRAAAVDARRFDLDVSTIRTPCLLVTGEGAGHIAQTQHERLAQALPVSESESMHTCGELPYLTHPHRLAKRVKQYLRDVESECHPGAKR